MSNLFLFFKLWLKKHDVKFTILPFLSVHFSKVNYIHIVQQISRTSSLCKPETVNTWNNSLFVSPSGHHHHPWQPQANTILLCVSEFDYFILFF